jgi:PAS domain S-box-containing protein
LFLSVASILGLLTDHSTEKVPLQEAVFIALIIAALFQPLRTRLNTSLNHYFYRAVYDYRDTVREASRQLSTILDVDALLNYLVRVIASTLSAEIVTAYLRATSDTFTLRATANSLASEIVPPSTIDAASPVVTLLATHRRLFNMDDVADQKPSSLMSQAASELSKINGHLAFPLFKDNSLAGVLVVANKLSGDPFLQGDLDLLSTLVSQASVAIENAIRYNEVILANEYIENTLATIDSGVIAVDCNGFVTLFNAAAARLTKLDTTEVKGSSLDRLPFVLAAYLKATATGGDAVSQIEAVIDDHLGSRVSVVVSTSSLRNRDGTILGAVAVLNDLTRIKQLEAEQHRIERLASIGALASGVAHEIKNPLVAIRTFAELLPERFSDEDFRTGFSQVMIREISRIDELVARLRGLATRPIQPLSTIDVREPLEAAVALLRPQAAQTLIAMTISVVDDLPLIVGDPSQLEQLFLNVLLNALDATPSKGVIEVTAARHRSPTTDYVTIKIRDTGSGIAPGLLGRIFDPFVTTKKQGSGLGLSICRGIADAHRATIRAFNNQGSAGATVAIDFPVTETSSVLTTGVR